MSEITIYLIVDGYIDVFYNQKSERVAFALIHENEGIYGVDNTGGWHVHPFADPSAHLPLEAAFSFGDFINEIEKFYKQ